MDFDFREEERELCKRIQGIFEDDSGAELETQLEHGDLYQVRETILDWMERLFQTGYLSLGMDGVKDQLKLVVAQETLAAIAPSLFLSVEFSLRIFGRLLTLYGRPDQKDPILQPLKEGRIIGAVGLSELGMSIENRPFATVGLPKGETYLVSGSKNHVVNAPLSDWIAVTGTVSGKSEEEVAFFLAEKKCEGISIGERLLTLGYNGVAVSGVELKNTPIPKTRVMGPFDGRGPLETLRMLEDQVLTVAGLGLMKRSLDTATQFAKTYKSGTKPIIAYQEIAFKLAEMLTLLQTAQLLAYRAAWMIETEDRERAALVRCAKVFCAESAEVAASQALQILGVHGYTRGNPAEAGYRGAKYLQIAGTSSELSRMKIADEVRIS